MSTQAWIAKQKKREELVKKYAAKRAQLKAEGNYAELAKLPRDSSATRSRQRCAITGRPRAVLRKFKITRHQLREMALRGLIPGLKKASW
jgi:small subunit ribosomal protein S14